MLPGPDRAAPAAGEIGPAAKTPSSRSAERRRKWASRNGRQETKRPPNEGMKLVRRLNSGRERWPPGSLRRARDRFVAGWSPRQRAVKQASELYHLGPGCGPGNASDCGRRARPRIPPGKSACGSAVGGSATPVATPTETLAQDFGSRGWLGEILPNFIPPSPQDWVLAARSWR